LHQSQARLATLDAMLASCDSVDFVGCEVGKAVIIAFNSFLKALRCAASAGATDGYK
jgi:hypothetical protein